MDGENITNSIVTGQLQETLHLSENIIVESDSENFDMAYNIFLEFNNQAELDHSHFTRKHALAPIHIFELK